MNVVRRPGEGPGIVGTGILSSETTSGWECRFADPGSSRLGVVLILRVTPAALCDAQNTQV